MITLTDVWQKTGTRALVEGGAELINGRGDFKPAEENTFLALKADVPRPTNETGEVPAAMSMLHTKEKFENAVVIMCK